MNAWKVILATLVIFGAGLVTGGLLVKRSQHGLSSGQPVVTQPSANPVPRSDSTSRATNRPFGSPLMTAGMRKDFLKNLDHELQLTSEQRERIEKILCQGQDCTKQLWDKVSPEVRAEWKRVKEAIRAELTDEQKEKFNECMKRSRKQEEHRDETPKTESPQSTPVETPLANP